MPEITYELALDDARADWLRARFTTVQYETTISGLRMPVVRFDNAHGFAHRDLLDRNGRIIEKRPIPGNPSPDMALAQGEREIRRNWPRYRAAFFGDEA
jgi:hypothetical protein